MKIRTYTDDGYNDGFSLDDVIDSTAECRLIEKLHSNGVITDKDVNDILPHGWEVTPLKQVNNGSWWQHTNGNQYIVMMLANVNSTNDRYVETVVYKNADNNNVFTRPLSDWHRSMTYVTGGE